MDDKKIDAMLRDLLMEIDYDMSKQYDVETAEEPEYVEDAMNDLRVIVRRHVCAREPGL